MKPKATKFKITKKPYNYYEDQLKKVEPDPESKYKSQIKIRSNHNETRETNWISLDNLSAVNIVMFLIKNYFYKDKL